jgi:hypothetical protein
MHPDEADAKKVGDYATLGRQPGVFPFENLTVGNKYRIVGLFQKPYDGTNSFIIEADDGRNIHLWYDFFASESETAEQKRCVT